jgi:predicted nucleic acid-binding protein
VSVADYLIGTSAPARILLRQATEEWERRVGAGTVGLLLAAVAEQSGLALLHFDRDFETIARTTGARSATRPR